MNDYDNVFISVIIAGLSVIIPFFSNGSFSKLISGIREKSGPLRRFAVGILFSTPSLFIIIAIYIYTFISNPLTFSGRLLPVGQLLVAGSWALASAFFAYFRTMDKHPTVQPTIRRAGKSFLTAALTAVGVIVFASLAKSFIENSPEYRFILFDGSLKITSPGQI